MAPNRRAEECVRQSIREGTLPGAYRPRQRRCRSGVEVILVATALVNAGRAQPRGSFAGGKDA
jgi:hypothetical protein